MWTFVSKYKNYSLQVTIEGVKRTINFRELGDYPAIFRGGGMFTTDDPDIIAALQAHPKYAGDYEYIVGGKEFTGTDEGPMVTWGDSTEYPIQSPQEESKFYRFISDEMNGAIDTSIVKDGDLLWDGEDLKLKRNGDFEVIAPMSTITDALSDMITFIKSDIYTETEGIGAGKPVPITIFSQAYPSFAPSLWYLHAVIIENLGPSVNLQVSCNSQPVLSGITIDSGEKKIFLIPSQRPLNSLDAGGGNSYVGISRPVATTTIKYQFIFAFMR